MNIDTCYSTTGSGKKNKRGGAPKQKGKLQSALAKEQLAMDRRAKERQLEQHRLQKQKLAQTTPDQLRAQKLLRKQAKAQRQKERDLERREDELIQQEAEERLQIEEANEAAQRLGGAGEAPIVVLEEVTDKKSQMVKRRRGLTPYKPGERILLVGEGNFSFAHSLLLQKPAIVTPHLMVATAYDSFETAQQKYPDLLHHVHAIREAGAQVLFDVDATKLEKVKDIAAHKGQWDRVVFNFPHVGQGITDQDRNVRANQTLILNFFRSVAPLLRVGTSSVPASGASTSKKNGKKMPPVSKKGKKRAAASTAVDSDEDEDDKMATHDDLDLDEDELMVDATSSPAVVPPPPTTSGTVLITLRTVSPYSLWSLPHLGSRGPLLAPSIVPRPLPKTPQPTFAVVRSFEFDPAEWQGYEHRRTIGYVEGVSSLPNDDLNLSAKERGERKRLEKEARERREKEERDGAELARRGGKALMRTYEFEWVPPPPSSSSSSRGDELGGAGSGANSIKVAGQGRGAKRTSYAADDFDYE